MKTRPRLAVSACLLGEKVRYDGEDKRTEWVLSLGTDFDLVGVCPETAIGLGVPRPTIGLYLVDGAERIRQNDDPSCDVTQDLYDYGSRQAAEGFSGFVLKARSPSCAIDDAELRDHRGLIIGRGQGGFVRGLLSVQSGIPVINEEQLHDATRRRAFIASVHAYAKQQEHLS
jgi:uncharacterized protein YbbK (DUF523 family)